jgi:hypothetical protein
MTKLLSKPAVAKGQGPRAKGEHPPVLVHRRGTCSYVNKLRPSQGRRHGLWLASYACACP